MAPVTLSFFLLVILQDNGWAIHGFAPRAKLRLCGSLKSGLGKNFRAPSLVFVHTIRNIDGFVFSPSLQ